METVTTWDWVQINTQPAIWSRDASEVEDEDYLNFYKSMGSEGVDPASWIHFKAEGEVEFKSILYVPGSAPYDQYDQYHQRQAAIRLYVRKVLITDEFDDLVPRYLNFLKGVVDSEDLPLNVSRETLQQHKVLKVMGKKLVRKALEMLRKLANKSNDDDDDEDDEDEDGEKKADEYLTFWKEFGKNLKLGVIEDSANRSKLTKLLRWKSSKTSDEGDWVSFEQYVSRMQDWQKTIYYIAAESIEAAERSPFLDTLKQRDVECLYLVDPIDEYAIQHITEFDGKKLVSITKEGLKLGDEDEKVANKRQEIYKAKFEGLTTYLKDLLSSKVSKIGIQKHQSATPAVMVTSQFGNSANMERIMRAQAFSDNNRMQHMSSQKTMEINPRHPLVIKLADIVEASPDDESTQDTAWMLYESAMMTSGFPIESPEDFAKRMFRVMSSGLAIDSLELEPAVEVALRDARHANVPPEIRGALLLSALHGALLPIFATAGLLFLVLPLSPLSTHFLTSRNFWLTALALLPFLCLLTFGRNCCCHRTAILALLAPTLATSPSFLMASFPLQASALSCSLSSAGRNLSTFAFPFPLSTWSFLGSRVDCLRCWHKFGCLHTHLSPSRIGWSLRVSILLNRHFQLGGCSFGTRLCFALS